MERREFLKSAAAVGAAAAFSVPSPVATGQNESPRNSIHWAHDSKPQPGVPAGSRFSFSIDNSRFYPGTTRMIDVYVPAQYTADKPACLWVSLDHLMHTLPAVFDNLIHKKELPVMIAVGLHPGTVASADAAQNPRFNRSFEFDSLTAVLARFIIEEMLPALEKQKTPNGLPILLSGDPNDRGITGGSTGGIGAFTAAWERPDAFRRVYSMIGTYVGMRGGDRYPVLVRKTEPKPLRIFLQDNDHDGWPGGLELGDWWMSNKEMERALTFAGYAVNHAWQKGGHDGRQGESILPEVMALGVERLAHPIEAARTSNFAVQAIVQPGKDWKPIEMPRHPQITLIDPRWKLICSAASDECEFHCGFARQRWRRECVHAESFRGNHLPDRHGQQRASVRASPTGRQRNRLRRGWPALCR